MSQLLMSKAGGISTNLGMWCLVTQGMLLMSCKHGHYLIESMLTNHQPSALLTQQLEILGDLRLIRL